MRLFTKILLASCLFIQTHPSCATTEMATTPPNADAESRSVMDALQALFHKHGEPIALNIIKGLEGKRNDMAELESETSFGKNPVLCAELKDGKLLVTASRFGNKEIKVDLTDDKTHKVIVEKLKSQGSEKPVTVYYTDSTGRKFELLAFGLKLLEKTPSSTSSTEERCFYCATEKEVTVIPAGATVVE